MNGLLAAGVPISLTDNKGDYGVAELNTEPIRSMVNRIFNDYIDAKQQPFAGNPIGSFFRDEIPSLIYSTNIVDPQTHSVTGSVGQGNWVTIPWIGIFDRSITTSAQRGVYIVYLLSKDGNSLYLTLNQGCTDIDKTHSKSNTVTILQNKAKEIRANINPLGFSCDDKVILGEKLPPLGEYYQKGVVFYKEYKKGSIPSEDDLQTDLRKMMQIYAGYVELIKSGAITKVVDDVRNGNGGNAVVTTKDAISVIKDYISAKRFSYEDGLIENFYLSLKTKPFVILAGISGTGKTRLGRLFAEALGATAENGRYKMVPVRPDWSDSSDLYGYKDLNGKFVPGVIIDFVKQAENDIMNPYFLCLDEMNLARVEYYLSDFLSIVETREFVGDRILTDPMVSDTYYGTDRSSIDRYGMICFPENLYVIGTVNMDETTFPFSRKVLDRANTLEFSYVNLMPEVDDTATSISPLSLNNNFLKSEYLLIGQCIEDADIVEEYCSELQSINSILEKGNAHVGYRVRDEIVFYLLNNKKADLIPHNNAMDNAIMQKILPRIQGSSLSIKRMLCDLFKHCAGDYEGYQTNDAYISPKMFQAAQRPECRYKRSAMKIAFMIGRYEEDGFTSYWL